jgi:hypothetical protein
MSHFTKIKTELRDVSAIRKALREMKRDGEIDRVEENSNWEMISFKIYVGTCYCALSPASGSDCYQFGSFDNKGADLLPLIESRYAKVLILEKLKAQGFLSQVQKLAGGRIRIRARKAA